MKMNTPSIFPPLKKSVVILAPCQSVWNALTEPLLMAQWMGDSEQQISIFTSWEPDSPFILQAHHHGPIENTGTVLAFNPTQLLSYCYQSSISNLPESAESKTVLRFELKPLPEGTELTLYLSNFPTESIYKHVDFYWNGTLFLLKAFVEELAD